MRIPISGASGFIGRHSIAALSAAGHWIICCVRDVDPELWLSRLRGIDAVVNCVEILHARDAESIGRSRVADLAEAVHRMVEDGVGRNPRRFAHVFSDLSPVRGAPHGVGRQR